MTLTEGLTYETQKNIRLVFTGPSETQAEIEVVNEACIENDR